MSLAVIHPPARGAMSKRRSLRKKLLLLFVSLLVGLLLVEVAVRVLGLDPGRIWEPDPELGWRHVPGERCRWTAEGNGWVVVNSLGQRDRERTIQKSPSSYRIAVFGDSMTEAVQVDLEQTFTYQLEERFRKEGAGVEVLNFGVSGYSMLQELLAYRREGPRYQPDLVILAVFLDNDVADCRAELRSSDAGSPLPILKNGRVDIDYSRAIASYEDYRRQPKCMLRACSALYRYLAALRSRTVGGSARDSQATVAPRRFGLYQDPALASWNEAWLLLEHLLHDFKSEVDRLGSRLIVLSVPAGQVVVPGAWEDVVQLYPAMANYQYDLRRPEQRLREICERRGIELLQPETWFRQAADPGGLFFGAVGHFTPQGHDLMAGFLLNALKERRLLDR